MSHTAVSFPLPGRLRLNGASLLSSPLADECRAFVAALFHLPDVLAIEINSRKASAEIRFNSSCTARDIARQVGTQLAQADGALPAAVIANLYVDERGNARLYRCNDVVSGWKIESDLPDRIRLTHPQLFRKKSLCHDVERDLMTVHGVDRFKVSATTGSVLIHFNEALVGKSQLIRLLDATLVNASKPPEQESGKYELLLCTTTVALAASAQFAVPALLFPAAALFVYCGIPTFISAWKVLTQERRLGVDVLDAIVIIMCLISVELFAGAVLTWCLSFGRKLLARAREDSRRRLVNVFGKQPRHAYVVIDGTEVNVPLDQVREGDIVAVHTGEMIPVDGFVRDGNALVDQQALTGESVPVEKQQGSRVYASTLLIGGRILVTVEKAGKDTTSAKISTILNDTAAFQLSSQSKGEEYADKAVIPTLALSALGFGTVGLQGATAIINCDFGTGIRMAAPIALLSSLSVCASRGILIKDGAALEQMASVDTVLFDKTGTLTQERPTVHKIHRLARWSEERILTFAAAAEQRVGHPIAAAIVAEFERLGKPFAHTDESSFQVGYGIGVTIDSKKVLVGSHRFLKLKRVSLGPKIDEIVEAAHAEGHSLVFVAVDKVAVGAIELAPALREGIPEMIAALRAGGVKQIVIISGDHEKPTENLARLLKVDRFFAEVLPEDKARYVELLQAEGRKVCFVGDGINDSIALKRANVSVSLRGATTVATDTAQVVFMEDNLNRLVDFMTISRQLNSNVRTSWHLILVPNLLCIGGAFFFGFGVMASVLANNVAAIAALANGLMPLRNLSRDPNRKGRVPALAHSSGNDAQGVLTPDDMGPRPVIHNARTIAAVSMTVGVTGLVVPVIPGWLLILSAIALLASQDSKLAPLDRWIHRKFPVARGDALRFLHGFLADLDRRFPKDSRERAAARSVIEIHQISSIQTSAR